MLAHKLMKSVTFLGWDGAVRYVNNTIDQEQSDLTYG